MKRTLPPGVRQVLAFFEAAPGAVAGSLNVAELARVVVVAAATGGGVRAVLAAVLAETPAIVTDPGNVALASALVAFLLEAARRLGHGPEEPGPRILPFRRPDRSA